MLRFVFHWKIISPSQKNSHIEIKTIIFRHPPPAPKLVLKTTHTTTTTTHKETLKKTPLKPCFWCLLKCVYPPKSLEKHWNNRLTLEVRERTAGSRTLILVVPTSRASSGNMVTLSIIMARTWSVHWCCADEPWVWRHEEQTVRVTTALTIKTLLKCAVSFFILVMVLSWHLISLTKMTAEERKERQQQIIGGYMESQ